MRSVRVRLLPSSRVPKKDPKNREASNNPAWRSWSLQVAEIDGRTEVLGVGAIRDHRLGLTLRHLRAGHYRLTLVELPAGGKPIVVGHSDLKVG